MARKHTVDEVVKSLSKKKDVKVDVRNKVVEILDNPYKNNDLGNGSWGKIDYLTNHAGFQKVFVEEFSSNRFNL